jgi:hypothetical protein
MHEINEGDVVFHYSIGSREIASWSRAVGVPWEDTVRWGSHALGETRSIVTPYDRPGWRLGLNGPFPISPPVSLEAIREQEELVRSVHETLVREHPKQPLYFSFEVSDKRPPRPTQFYITKFPRSLVLAFSQLSNVVEQASTTPERQPPTDLQAAIHTIGVDYQDADEASRSAKREPFDVDPDIVDRGRQGHARIQNQLAERVRSLGFRPKRPTPTEPQYDLAWDTGAELFVAEVKSCTERNQEKQLRLGLGQVLRYRQVLSSRGKPVRAVLAVESRPFDPSWNALCDALGVLLLWPDKIVSFSLER